MMLRAAVLTACLLFAGPAVAQRSEPANYDEALERTERYYEEVALYVNGAIGALESGNLAIMGQSSRLFGEVFPFLMAEQGRACWLAEYRGANPDYPKGGTMAGILATWTALDAFVGPPDRDVLDMLITQLRQLQRILRQSLVSVQEMCGSHPGVN